MATAQELISGKWKILILWNLSEGPMRFGELMRNLPGITQSTLTNQLRSLEKNNLVHREAFLEVPPHVEYSLTAIGQEFQPVLESIYQWGLKYIAFAQDEAKNDETATNEGGLQMTEETATDCDISCKDSLMNGLLALLAEAEAAEAPQPSAEN